jgi:phytoene/squalene synthetase
VAVLGAGVLAAIERQGYDVFGRRVGLTAGQKLRRVPAAWRLARRTPGRPVPRVF